MSSPRTLAGTTAGLMALALLASLLAGSAWAGADRAHRVMVVGDSISQGRAGDLTWRYQLARHLESAAPGVTLVGVRTDLKDGSHSYADPDFPQEHSAQWGLTLARATTRIAEQVRAARPDVLLVLLGTNDLAWGGWRDGAGPANLVRLLANARSVRPDLAVVLGELPPSCSTAYMASLPTANAQLRAGAVGLSTPVSPVTVVAMDPSYRVASDAYDCVHPNRSGEYKIATSFARGLAGLGIGSPMPPP